MAPVSVPHNSSPPRNRLLAALSAADFALLQPLLRQSIQANDKFGAAYYELGMVYIRLGKMAEAKQNLMKYLELEPNGKEAGTVKETLKYLQ